MVDRIDKQFPVPADAVTAGAAIDIALHDGIVAASELYQVTVLGTNLYIQSIEAGTDDQRLRVCRQRTVLASLRERIERGRRCASQIRYITKEKAASLVSDYAAAGHASLSGSSSIDRETLAITLARHAYEERNPPRPPTTMRITPFMVRSLFAIR